jgi:predicted transposase/invertase (TIGR01784 family)
VSILITDYPLITENEAYHNSYTLYDKTTGSEFTDVIQVDVLELPKLPPQGDGTELSDWLQFLRSKNREELAVIEQRSPELKKVVGILMDLSADEQTRLEYEAYEKARMDEESRMRGAWNKGVAEGIEIGDARGEFRGKLKTALAMINYGDPVEKAAHISGIPIDELLIHIKSPNTPQLPQ